MCERAMDTRDRDDDAHTTDEPHVALLHDHVSPEDEHEQCHQGQPSPPQNILSALLFWPVGKGLQQSHTRAHEHTMGVKTKTNTMNSGETRQQGTTGGRRCVFIAKVQTVAQCLGRV